MQRALNQVCVQSRFTDRANTDDHHAVAITSFEEAKRADLENERLPPSSQEVDQQQQKETNEKIRHAMEEEDGQLNHVADVIVSDI